MIARQLSHLAGEAAASIGQDDLGLAVAARIEQDVSDRRMAGVILEADAELEFAQRDPDTLAAPADVNDFLAIGQELEESLDR